MSVTFYVDGWSEQEFSLKKVYDALDIDPRYYEEDPDYKLDSEGFYRMEKIYVDRYPEVTVGCVVASSIFKALGYQESPTGEFPVEQLNEVFKRVFRVINKMNQNGFYSAPIVEGRVFDFGISNDQLYRRLASLLQVIKFAIRNNKSVYWG